MRRLLTALALVVAAPAAPAAELTLDEVLASSARHAPQILEAVARENQADARMLSAQGLYDLVFDGEVRWRALGYYDNATLDARATRPFTGNGAAVQFDMTESEEIVLARSMIRELGTMEAIEAWFTRAEFVPPPFAIIEDGDAATPVEEVLHG